MTLEEKENLEAEPALETEEDRTLDAPADGDDAQGIDPLDQITDPEALRAEAKKQRGIAARLAKGPKEEEPAAPVVVTPAPVASEFLTKKDFERSNQKKAIRIATTPSDTDDEATQAAKEEIEANWDQVRIHYSGRRGKDTPEDIVEDLLDAHAVWKRKNGSKAADPQGDATRALAPTAVTRPGGSSRAPAPASGDDSDPRFNKASQPDQWYKKKK